MDKNLPTVSAWKVEPYQRLQKPNSVLGRAWEEVSGGPLKWSANIVGTVGAFIIAKLIYATGSMPPGLDNVIATVFAVLALALFYIVRGPYRRTLHALEHAEEEIGRRDSILAVLDARMHGALFVRSITRLRVRSRADLPALSLEVVNLREDLARNVTVEVTIEDKNRQRETKKNNIPFIAANGRETTTIDVRGTRIGEGTRVSGSVKDDSASEPFCFVYTDLPTGLAFVPCGSLSSTTFAATVGLEGHGDAIVLSDELDEE